MGYIYKIVNNINNKVYIGLTKYKNPKLRFYKHLADYNMPSASRTKRPLYDAMHKYGPKNFSFYVIEEVPNELLGEREQYWIKYYNSYIGAANSNGYNATLGGDGGHATLSDTDIKLVISEYLAGKSITSISKQLHHTGKTILQCLKDNNIVIRHKRNRKVIQLDKDLTIVHIFNNMSEANSYFGKDKHHSKINEVCNGNRKTAYGYYWKYE